MTTYLLGVDIGSSKTHALIADAHGRPLGLGHAGAGNHEGVGYAGMGQALGTALEGALAAAGVALHQIAAAGLGVSGYDWPSQTPRMRATVREAGLGMPFAVVNDTVLGLLAGAPEGWGVALVSGTGCNCCGRDRSGRTARVTGEGGLFGEFGGGGDLAMRAVQCVSRAWSRRGPPTLLSELLVAALGARDVEDLLEGLAVGRLRARADLAPLVFQAAAAGDLAAQQAVEWAGRALADLALGVVRQLDLAGETFDLVLIGSMFNGGAPLVDPLRADLHAEAPGARLVRLQAPPVVGAVLLALEQLGGPSAEARATLLRETPALLDRPAGPASPLALTNPAGATAARPFGS
jgi:N-acetylglucosamine kinase-like BadF-type ATPase